MASSAAARSRAAASAAWARLLSLRPSPPVSSTHHLTLRIASPRRHFAFSANASSGGSRLKQIQSERVIHDLFAELQRERQRDRQEEDEDEGEDEDYLGVKPLIEKLERRRAKEEAAPDDSFWEPTDSDSDEEDERYTPDAIKRRVDEFERKCNRHSELLRSFAEAGKAHSPLPSFLPSFANAHFKHLPLLPETLDDAHKWMTKIDRFEERHLKLPLEYRVIGDMMNRLKDATGKDRFLLLQKLNRAVRIMECREAYDPSNPSNFGVIQHQQVGSPEDLVLNAGFDREKQMIQGAGDDNDDEEFNEDKEKDDLLIEKLNSIEKKIEEKLAELDHTFGKKGRVLEEEIKDLVEERNSLTEHKRRPMYRKVSDVHLRAFIGLASTLSCGYIAFTCCYWYYLVTNLVHFTGF